MIADWSDSCGFIVLAFIILSNTSMYTLQGGVSAAAFLSVGLYGWKKFSQ
jgi:hypothetical protein